MSPEHAYKPAVIEGARMMILAYLADGPQRPGDLETFLCGVSGAQAMSAIFMGYTAWSRSPFQPALAALVEVGEVVAMLDTRGWLYSLGSSTATSSPTTDADLEGESK